MLLGATERDLVERLVVERLEHAVLFAADGDNAGGRGLKLNRREEQVRVTGG